ncbi:MAG: DUF1836 domain-containing protein [Erysipelotrichaceae bacterium]|nr:DUF1836 domain-containing protein [Erysipelotrichaceae bacterium]
MTDTIKNFRLPRYLEITNVGLYLEQTVKFINGYLAPLGEPEITASMVSNYVKLKLLANPDRKQYTAEHLAVLMFIAISKTVVTLDDIRFLLAIQKDKYPAAKAYDHFCTVFEETLFNSFGIKNAPATDKLNHSQENELLRSAVFAVVQKIYLDQYLLAYRNMEIADQQ